MRRIDISALRSQLFIPVLAAHFIEKAAERGADAIILDLEDAIAEEAKDRARNALRESVAPLVKAGLPVMVRVNADEERLEKDLEAALALPVDAIYLPKVEKVKQVASVARILEKAERKETHPKDQVSLILLLETPLGIQQAYSLASASERVSGVVFGSEDYALALEVEPCLETMRFPAQLVALAARAAGIAAFGVIGSITEIGDMARFREMAQAARDVGYTGACAIHPRQVSILNEVFGVGEDEVERAVEIVKAYEAAAEQGVGAVALDGKMLDKPVVERARRLLSRPRRRLSI